MRARAKYTVASLLLLPVVMCASIAHIVTLVMEQFLLAWAPDRTQMLDMIRDAQWWTLGLWVLGMTGLFFGWRLGSETKGGI